MQEFICSCPHRLLLNWWNCGFNIFNELWKGFAYLFEFQQCTWIWILRRKVNHLSLNPHYFLNKIIMLLIIRFLHFFLNNFCICKLHFDSTICDALSFHILLNMKITKYMVCLRENFGNDIHQSGVPIGDNHLRHVEFWDQNTNQHFKCPSKVIILVEVTPTISHNSIQ